MHELTHTWHDEPTREQVRSLVEELVALCYPALGTEESAPRLAAIVAELARSRYTRGELAAARRMVPHDPRAGHAYRENSTTLLPDLRRSVERARTLRRAVLNEATADEVADALSAFPSLEPGAFYCARSEDGAWRLRPEARLALNADSAKALPEATR